MGSRVLVTGGAGYLGSVLCESLLAAGHSVMVLDSLLYNQQSVFHLCANPNFEFVRGDVRDERVLGELVPEADVLIPLAAIVGAPACDRNPWSARGVNLDAIGLLLRLRSEQQLVIYPTTNSGYGTKSGDTFCTEDTPLEPVSLYGRTKVEAEALVLDSPRTITLRLATVFGMSPRMRLDLLVNHFVWAAVTDRYLIVFEKDFKRNYIHIRDVADCFLHAIRNAGAMVGRAFNVGLDDANISKAELAEKVRGYIPEFFIHYAAIGKDPDRRNCIVSNQRLREAGFKASRSIDAGIEELLKGYRAMGRQALGNV